ncbi:MAG: serine O-acetyltransferase [Deltaproteobacteria bacterium]|nr:MAG: serine O-acetyltransferase [Deltaproteobacteria bacterium]
MFETFREDLRAIQRNDPAAKSVLESVLCHTPLHAITLYRIAHWLHTRARLPLVPRLISVLAHFLTGVEIHPAAKIGRRFFIDHGTGVVIGETSEIGDDCVLFHNVTLGGTGKHRGKRHPTLGDNVLVGTGAILLGPVRVGSNSRIGANSFLRMHDVPPNSTVIGIPARLVKRDGARVDLALEPTELPATAIPVPDAAERGDTARARTGGGPE